MYGLKQAAQLAYDNFNNNLASSGYQLDPITPNIWTHVTRRTKCCLCVDDFGVKYFNQDDVDYLLKALKKNYDITVDTTCNNFCGLSITWDYNKGYVDIYM